MNLTRALAPLLAFIVLGAPAWAQSPPPMADCGAPMAKRDSPDKLSVVEDGKTVQIADKQVNTRAAKRRTTCRSRQGYTVCSNGRYGCIWSDRTERLLGCGPGL